MKLFRALSLAFTLVFATIFACSCSVGGGEYLPSDENLFDFVAVQGGYALSAKQGIELPETICIPKTYNNQPVVMIKSQAFEQSSIKKVVLPETVATIGVGAFTSCPELRSVEIGEGLKTISAYAFAYCEKLYDCELPDSLITIGDGAFQATHLTDVELWNSVESVGKKAFYNCEYLTNVYVGTKVSSIGEQAFDGTNSNLVFELSEKNTAFKIVNGKLVTK